MNPETEKALRESIAHWKKVEEGTAYSCGVDTCALCQRFFGVYHFLGDAHVLCAKDGERCPVYSRTGYNRCKTTPYLAFYEACCEQRDGLNKKLYAKTEAQKTAALAEVAFLESLLPNEEESK